MSYLRIKVLRRFGGSYMSYLRIKVLRRFGGSYMSYLRIKVLRRFGGSYVFKIQILIHFNNFLLQKQPAKHKKKEKRLLSPPLAPIARPMPQQVKRAHSLRIACS